MDLLKKLTEVSAVSGNEENLFSLINSELKDLSDESYTDLMGNLVFHKKGKGKKMMLSAHADEIGIMVNYIDDNGFLRFSPVGGVDIYSSLYQRVEFKNGTIGTVCIENTVDKTKEIKMKNMYIDIGVSSKEEALKYVSYGDTASFTGDYIDRSNTVVSKSLDNRSGVYILINVIKMLKDSPFDLYFVFSSQEEVGLRGAKVAAYNINPDIALAIDVTDTGDTPECEILDVYMGKGAAIKITDKSVMCNKKIIDALERCAKENNIPYQFEILTFGGTDAGAMQTIKSGALTGAVSLPVRYIHTPCETAYKKDIESCISLVYNFCTKDFIFE